MTRAPQPALGRRLLFVVLVVAVVGLALAAAIWLQNAREGIRAEGDNFTRFAIVSVVDAAARHAAPEEIRELIGRLDALRHVQIARMTAGPAGKAAPREMRSAHAPAWFFWLMDAGQSPFYQQIVDAGPGVGPVLIRTDPSDEIDENWSDVEPMLWLSAVMLACLSMLLYAVVHFSLLPLSDLAAAIIRMQSGDFSLRVRENVVRELYPIYQRFNWMAEVLQRTTRENRELARSMIVLREEERVRLARELHDEFSPMLFSVKMSLALAIDGPAGRVSQERARLEAIAATVAELEQNVRGMLGWLRSATLDELGLTDALEDLVDGWRKRLPAIDWALCCDGPLDDLDETGRINVYRIVQESLTNAAKHAKASRVSVRTRCTQPPDEPRLYVEIEDNGVGLKPASVDSGFGLRGMEERLHALGGTLALMESSQSGLRLCAELPMDRGDRTDTQMPICQAKSGQ